ncbi:MAG TPA: hypothetical protein VKR27_00840 [Acidimicrobiales bacterium]|nr:hypothetical protein [Acidimicrobiales bacterium]
MTEAIVVAASTTAATFTLLQVLSPVFGLLRFALMLYLLVRGLFEEILIA